MAKRKYEYLLGDSPKEAERLRRQAELWDPVAHALFDRLGVKRGWKVLEVGPGRGSLHLELRRRVRGSVDAVERSPVFADNLRALCKRDGFGSPWIWETDLLDADLPRSHYDLIFVRWVFLFLPDPLKHLRKLVDALKPGGRLAIQDYHRETQMLIPRVPEWENFMAADRAFFATQGGDVSVGGRLPELFWRAGLRVEKVHPTLKHGRPGSAVWNWLSEYYLEVMPKYGKLRPFTPAQARALSRKWKAAAKNPTSLLIAPTVLDVVGRKPLK